MQEGWTEYLAAQKRIRHILPAFHNQHLITSTSVVRTKAFVRG
jgi:hypothetical protein